MSNRFYVLYHSKYDLLFAEIAALRVLDKRNFKAFETWFFTSRDEIIDQGEDLAEKTTFIKLLKEQPEFNQAKSRVNQHRTQSRGY